MNWTENKPTQSGYYFCKEKEAKGDNWFNNSLDLALANVRKDVDGKFYVKVFWEDISRPTRLLEDIDNIQYWSESPISIPE